MKDVNLIQRGELQGRLVRGLGIRERSPAPVLSTEVVPVVLLEDLARSSSFDVGVERPAAGYYDLAADALNLGVVALKNPGGSGIICIVDRIIFTSPVNAELYIGLNESTPANVAGAQYQQWIDGRIGGAPAARIYQQIAAVGFTAPIAKVWITGGGVQTVEGPFFLRETACLALEGVATNTRIMANFIWRERYITL